MRAAIAAMVPGLLALAPGLAVAQDDRQLTATQEEVEYLDLGDEGVSSSWFLCFAALRLDDEGQITLQGLMKFEGQTPAEAPFTVAITGGTGDFSSASGEAEIAVLKAPDLQAEVRVARHQIHHQTATRPRILGCR
jgi:hypothetical protein